MGHEIHEILRPYDISLVATSPVVQYLLLRVVVYSVVGWINFATMSLERVRNYVCLHVENYH